MSRKKRHKRDFGMSWEQIAEYDKIINAIAAKYSNNAALKADVVQEVKLRLHTDKNLDITKFDPKKRDAAIRNTIRNKALKVLKSRKVGRWQFTSLDSLLDLGVQIDTDYHVIYPSNPSNARMYWPLFCPHWELDSTPRGGSLSGDDEFGYDGDDR